MNRVRASIERSSVESLTLHIDYKDCVEKLVGAIGGGQERVSGDNCKDFVRDIVRKCPETYTALSEDGPLRLARQVWNDRRESLDRRV